MPEHNPPHVMWVGMTTTHLIGPYYFFLDLLTHLNTRMLEAWLIPQFRDTWFMKDVWLQHNRAPTRTHFTLTVCDILNKHYSGCLICHGLLTSPLCSPDLTTPGNSLWGIIMGQVIVHYYHNNDKLHRHGISIHHCYTTDIPQTLWCMSHRPWEQSIRLCFEQKSANTDPLNVQRWLIKWYVKQGYRDFLAICM
jgi:hypothetical protein